MIFLKTIFDIATSLLTIYSWVLLIAVILTWVRADYSNPIVNFIYRITLPLLSYIRSKIPLVFNGIDFSPLVAFIGIQLLVALLNQIFFWIYRSVA